MQTQPQTTPQTSEKLGIPQDRNLLAQNLIATKAQYAEAYKAYKDAEKAALEGGLFPDSEHFDGETQLVTEDNLIFTRRAKASAWTVPAGKNMSTALNKLAAHPLCKMTGIASIIKIGSTEVKKHKMEQILQECGLEDANANQFTISFKEGC